MAFAHTHWNPIHLFMDFFIDKERDGVKGVARAFSTLLRTLKIEP